MSKRPDWEDLQTAVICLRDDQQDSWDDIDKLNKKIEYLESALKQKDSRMGFIKDENKRIKSHITDVINENEKYKRDIEALRIGMKLSKSCGDLIVIENNKTHDLLDKIREHASNKGHTVYTTMIDAYHSSI